MRQLGSTIATLFRLLIEVYQATLCELGLRTCKFCRDNRAHQSVSAETKARREDRKP